jgi:hypothetical protein
MDRTQNFASDRELPDGASRMGGSAWLFLQRIYS